jgi:hypothetical protein
MAPCPLPLPELREHDVTYARRALSPGACHGDGSSRLPPLHAQQRQQCQEFLAEGLPLVNRYKLSDRIDMD